MPKKEAGGPGGAPIGGNASPGRPSVDPLGFGPFTGLRTEVRELLTSRGREVRVPAGEKLIWEKSAASGCYVLLIGALRVVGGPGETLATLRPPALVGEVASVRSGPRTASVVAESPSTLFFIPIAALREAMADDPAFAAALKAHVERVMGGGRD